jgi:hypothetical protein
MENSGPENTQQKISDKPSDSATNVQANSGTKAPPKTKNQPSKAKADKWTLREHWERSSSAKRVKWVLQGIGVLLNDQTFSILSDFSPQKITVTDLCPPGSVQ